MSHESPGSQATRLHQLLGDIGESTMRLVDLVEDLDALGDDRATALRDTILNAALSISLKLDSLTDIVTSL